MKPTIRERLKAHGWTTRGWAAIEHDLIYSEALATLSATAMRVLIRLLHKREYHQEGKGKKRHIIYHKTPLAFTYQEASCLGIPRATFSRAIKDLCRVGFIEIAHQGGSIGIVKEKDVKEKGAGMDWSTYRLIDDWKYYGTDKFIPREKIAPPLRTSRSIAKYNESGRPKHPKGKKTITIVTSDTAPVPITTLMSPESTARGVSKVTQGNSRLFDHEAPYGASIWPIPFNMNQNPFRVSESTLFI